MKNAFVTGGSGLVGYHLVKLLTKRGVTVRCLVRKNSNRSDLINLGVKFIEGDLNDSSALRTGTEGVDAVFHIAGLTRAIRSQEFLDVNGSGCRHVAEAILANATAGIPVPAVVSVSSLAAAGAGIRRSRSERDLYASKHRPRLETDVPVPFSPYGKSKLAGEREWATVSDRIPVTIVRPAIVFGEKDSLSFPLFQMAKKTPFFLIPGYVNRPFSFVYAGDLADLLIQAAERGERLTPLSLTPATDGASDSKRPSVTSLPVTCSGRGIYFASGPDNVLFSEFGKMLRKAVGGSRVIPLRCPPAAVLAIGLLQEGKKRLFRRYASLDLDKAKESLGGPWICSSEKSESQLGFHPGASFQEELDRTARWYADNHWF